MSEETMPASKNRAAMDITHLGLPNRHVDVDGLLTARNSVDFTTVFVDPKSQRAGGLDAHDRTPRTGEDADMIIYVQIEIGNIFHQRRIPSIDQDHQQDNISPLIETPSFDFILTLMRRGLRNHFRHRHDGDGRLTGRPVWVLTMIAHVKNVALLPNELRRPLLPLQEQCGQRQLMSSQPSSARGFCHWHGQFLKWGGLQVPWCC